MRLVDELAVRAVNQRYGATSGGGGIYAPWRMNMEPPAQKSARTGVTAVGGLQGVGIPDPVMLRYWAETEPFVFRAITHRVAQVSNAKFKVIAVDPLKPIDEAAKEALTNMFNAPNPREKNNSASALMQPTVFDYMSLGMGSLVPAFDGLERVVGLQNVDSARVRFIPNWNGSDTSPRYRLIDEANPAMSTALYNRELITMVANPVSYRETGISPLAVLYEFLRAWQETFLSARRVQQHRTPSGFLNIAGIPRKDLMTARRRYEADIEGNSAVALTSFKADDLKYVQLGSVNLLQQGTFQFADILIRGICAAFSMSPTDLFWTQNGDRTTAVVEADITIDDGVKPTLRSIASYYNTEVVATYPGSNLQYVWSALQVDDEPQPADIIRTRFGEHGRWMSINETRISDGLEPFDIDQDALPILWAFFNEPSIPVGMGDVQAPVSIAARIIPMLAAQGTLLSGPGPSNRNDSASASSDSAAASADPVANQSDDQTGVGDMVSLSRGTPTEDLSAAIADIQDGVDSSWEEHFGGGSAI